MSLMIASLAIGRAATFAPDILRAKISAKKLFAILDRKPLVDSSGDGGFIPEKCSGRITFEDVHFTYDSRPDVPVLCGLNLDIAPGQKVALVGESGSGKSTIVALIERFYDCTRGDLLLDGHRVQDVNVAWMRNQLGLVQQEPVLFDSSVADNISYGRRRGDHTLADIIEVAKLANIHDFISSLPLGYDTNVGAGGSQLSGGQKQRVAIARALFRDPKVILLDEATSALDAESEKEVQKALQVALQGRTSITIAHCLSTVQHSDCIFVISDGRVVEKGKHNELMAMNGHYKKLVNSQLTF